MFSADFLALTAEKQKCHPQARPAGGRGMCARGTVRVPLVRKIRARVFGLCKGMRSPAFANNPNGIVCKRGTFEGSPFA